jgi:hypothetical protein
MKYAAEMGSGAMIRILSYVKTRSGVVGECGLTDSQTE